MFQQLFLVYGTIYGSLNRPQKCPNMVFYGMFSQQYIQYPVRARAYVRSRLFTCYIFLMYSKNSTLVYKFTYIFQSIFKNYFLLWCLPSIEPGFITRIILLEAV